MEHCTELLLKSSGETVVNPTKWLPLWPSPEGAYPTVDWGTLDDKSGKVAVSWKEMVAARPGISRKLPVPQLRVAPSVCRGVRLVALNLNLERKNLSLTLSGVPVFDKNSQPCSLHMKAHLSLPTPDGKFRVMRRDSLAIMQTGREFEMLNFGDQSWNKIDPERLPQLNLTLLPVDPLDEKWWWRGMPPVRPDDAGVYPRVDWSSLGGELDWFDTWKCMIENDNDVSKLLCLPQMYLPDASRVVIMFLMRPQPDMITLVICNHIVHKKVSLVPITFNMDVELELSTRQSLQVKRRLKRSHKVNIEETYDVLCMSVEDWKMMDPDVPPAMSVKITNVQ